MYMGVAKQVRENYIVYVPHTRCLLLPVAAYIHTGTNAPYKPNTEGTPANAAYEMPWGTTVAATDMPDITSLCVC